MLAMMEGNKLTKVKELNESDKDDKKNLNADKTDYFQLHSVLEHGSSSDAMLSTLFILMQQQQQKSTR